MSIIFEALRKIEKEKGEAAEAGVPLSFAVKDDETAAPARSRRRRGLICAAIGIPFLFLAVIVLRPGWVGITGGRAPAPLTKPPATRPQPVIKEVRLQSKKILPFTSNISSKPLDAPPPVKPSGPAGSSEMKLPELLLKGVSHGKIRSWAFINNKMLKKGDSIEGAEIVEISSDRVKLNYRGMEFMLTY